MIMRLDEAIMRWGEGWLWWAEWRWGLTAQAVSRHMVAAVTVLLGLATAMEGWVWVMGVVVPLSALCWWLTLVEERHHRPGTLNPRRGSLVGVGVMWLNLGGLPPALLRVALADRGLDDVVDLLLSLGLVGFAIAMRANRPPPGWEPVHRGVRGGVVEGAGG